MAERLGLDATTTSLGWPATGRGAPRCQTRARRLEPPALGRVLVRRARLPRPSPWTLEPAWPVGPRTPSASKCSRRRRDESELIPRERQRLVADEGCCGSPERPRCWSGPPSRMPMSLPLAASLTLVLSCATLATAHVWLALGLMAAPERRWRGLALLLPFAAWLAPYWGYRSGLRGRSWLWVGSLLAYIASRICVASTG